jgi:hypothetical protein
VQLGQPRAQRFEYNHESEKLTLGIMPESNFHNAFAHHVHSGIENLLLQSLGDAGVERVVSFIHTTSTTTIKKERGFTYQPDFAFHLPGAPFASLVGEVS